MIEKIAKRYAIEVETITPVSIGTGEILSPLSDYWVEENKGRSYACILDKTKWENGLLNAPSNCIDVYLDAVKGNTENQSNKNQFLPNFIKDVLKENPTSFRLEDNIDIIGRGNAVELKRTLQGSNQLLIPGSTLKGAIKSAILYNWLILEDKESTFKKIVDLLNSKNVKKKGSLESKDLDKLLNGLITDCLYGKGKDERMDFSIFRVEDIYFSESIKPVWIHSKRYRLRSQEAKPQGSIPVFLEAINTGSKTKSFIGIENSKLTYNSNEYLKQFFNCENGIQNLFTVINKYAKDNLSYEKASIQLSDKNTDQFKSELNQINALIPNDLSISCYLPIGFGKTNFYQSIGLALYDWIADIEGKDNKDYQYAFRNYLALYKIGKKGQKHMPVTRLLSMKNQQPLGWIKITLKD